MICGDIWVSCDAKNYGNYGFLVMQMGSNGKILMENGGFRIPPILGNLHVSG